MRRVCLNLGGVCKLSCNYCTGRDSKYLNWNEDTLDYLYDFYTKDYEGPRHLSMSSSESDEVFERCVKVIERFKPLSNITFFMNVSGIGLNESVVSFFNSVPNLMIGLSHDGPNVIETRGYNSLENKCILENFRNIKNKCIKTVITAKSQDFDKIEQYVHSILPNIDISFSILKPHRKPTSDIYNFDYDSFDKQIEDLSHFRSMSMGHKFLYRYFVDCTKYLFNDLSNVSLTDTCTMKKNCIDINIEGSFINCNSDELQGTIYDSSDKLTEYCVNNLDLVANDSCSTCMYYKFCRPVCAYRKLDITYYCGIRKILNKYFLLYAERNGSSLKNIV